MESAGPSPFDHKMIVTSEGSGRWDGHVLIPTSTERPE
jgi:hypothetical protein